MPENTILAVKNLVAGYGETEILHDINVKVSTKEIVSIIGPNGAGKSTVMKAILGILDIKRGNIILDSDNVTGVKPSDIVSLGVGYVPQTDNVFVSLTVQENLEMGAWTLKSGLEKKFDECILCFQTWVIKGFKQLVNYLEARGKW